MTAPNDAPAAQAPAAGATPVARWCVNPKCFAANAQVGTGDACTACGQPLAPAMPVPEYATPAREETALEGLRQEAARTRPMRDALHRLLDAQAVCTDAVERRPYDEDAYQRADILRGRAWDEAVALYRAALRERDAARETPIARRARLSLLRDRAANAEAEAQRFAAAVVEYGYHHDECDFMAEEKPCTCGYEAIRAAARPATEPRTP